MENFLQDKTVQYVCSCGIMNPINKLFFCRHCPRLKCSFCVCHEVDSHFCSNCLENIPSSEARHRKNCCANCFDCPSCQHNLSARATTVVVQKKRDSITSKEISKDDETSIDTDSLKSINSSASTTSLPGSNGSKLLTKKMYYLSCLNCRWTTRDVGIPDKNVATGAWPDQDCAYQMRFNGLSEYYQSVVQQDRLERQEFMKRKMPKSHKFSSLTDRTGLTVAIIRRQMGWPDKSMQKIKSVQISPSEAVDYIDDLPETIFTQPIDLKNITTIKQRHNQPADQPFNINKLYPQRRCMWVKRSLRCRQCEHSVIKPEYHPTSIKYRIHLFAAYHVPIIRLIECDKALQPGVKCYVILKLINPTIHDMTVQLKTLPDVSEEAKLMMEFKELYFQRDVSLPSVAGGSTMDSIKSISNMPSLNTANTSSLPSLTRQSMLSEEPRVMKRIANSKFLTVDQEFVLNLRDDAKEFEEESQTENDDPPLIIWRKSNKVAIRAYLIPDDNLKIGDDVFIGFNMLYTYINTMGNAPERRDPTKHDMNCCVYIKVGQIAIN